MEQHPTAAMHPQAFADAYRELEHARARCRPDQVAADDGLRQEVSRLEELTREKARTCEGLVRAQIKRDELLLLSAEQRRSTGFGHGRQHV